MKPFIAMLFAVTAAYQLLWPNAADAQDAQTYEEKVCAPLDDPNVTKGLLGLCLAYCALDTEGPVDINDKEAVKNAKKSNKILSKYNRKKTDSDPAMPCRKVPCPCWTQDEMSNMGYQDGATGTQCGEPITNSFTMTVFGGNDLSGATAVNIAPALDTAPESEKEQRSCSFQDTFEGVPFHKEDKLKAEEAEACVVQLTEQCDNLAAWQAN